MKQTIRILAWSFIALFWACEPSKMEDIDLGPLPQPPVFELSLDPDNPNRVIARDLSEGFFNRLWIATGGQPSTSSAVVDTFFFPRAGEYTIQLYGASRSGSGTSQSSKTITIEQDATLSCDGPISILTDGCIPAGKCWKFSSEAGAIKVGPTYGSGEWFQSPANGLVPEQVAARWCFEFETTDFVFRNNGVTISPWDGYVAVPHDPTQGPWQFSAGTGQNGADQIILTPGQFMGTWDSGHVLDIAQLSEDRLIVRSRLVNRQGVPEAQGWFEFVFVSE